MAKNTSIERAPCLLRLLGGLLCSGTLSYASTAIAQVNNADLACYLHSSDGIQYDLSALCGGFTPTPVAEIQENIAQDDSADAEAVETETVEAVEIEAEAVEIEAEAAETEAIPTIEETTERLPTVPLIQAVP